MEPRNEGSNDLDEYRRQICVLRIAYMYLFKQYLDLDDEFHKLLGWGNRD